MSQECLSFANETRTERQRRGGGGGDGESALILCGGDGDGGGEMAAARAGFWVACNKGMRKRLGSRQILEIQQW